jgi:multidrug resistance efflux pump
MIELMIAVYGTIWWLVFKKFKLIPVNQWSVVTSVLIGISIIGFVLMMVNLYQPSSKDGRSFVYTTPIVSQVKGKVIEVPVEPNKPLQKGDVLFRIDPIPFQNKLDSLLAELELAETRLEQETLLLANNAGTQYEVDKYISEVDRLSADVAGARFDLEYTVTLAPTDGMVTQVFLQPGAMAVSLPLSPVMVFLHTEKQYFVVTYKQNVLQGIKPGLEVEIAFNAIPGRVFTGVVDRTLPVLGEGQISPSGRLLQFAAPSRPGRAPILISVTDDLSDYNLPIGAQAQVAVYTEHFKVFGMVRRIILRIASWENYIFLP